MLEEYLHVMRNEHGKTNLAEHNNVTSEVRPWPVNSFTTISTTTCIQRNCLAVVKGHA